MQSAMPGRGSRIEGRGRLGRRVHMVATEPTMPACLLGTFGTLEPGKQAAKAARLGQGKGRRLISSETIATSESLTHYSAPLARQQDEGMRAWRAPSGRRG